MKYLKRFFSVVAMALCFTLCVDSVSHAAAIKYKETKLSSPVKGFKSVNDVKLRVDSSGKIQLNLYKYHVKQDVYYDTMYACVTYNSNGKKQVNMAGTIHYSDTISRYSNYHRDVYGNYGYLIYDFDDNNNRLIACKKDGEVVKTVKLDGSKYQKRKTDHISFKIAEITAKNKVRLFYYYLDWRLNIYTGYGGMIEVNTKTKKIKKLVETDFVPAWYDGEYVYGEEYKSVSSHGSVIKKTLFYQKSIKTKKKKNITMDGIVYDNKKYKYLGMEYSFYKGKIMVVCPTGEVYYATFDDKKFEKVGDISHCKNFRKYKTCGFAMKSKNEFYILYMPELKKIPPKDECRNSYGKVFLARYKK